MTANKIDKRITYILDLDTETANTQVDEAGKMDMSCVLVYDCGWQIIDKRGNVYLRRSFVNADIFLDEKELMKSAYYAKKIPQYWEDIKAHRRILATTATIRKTMLEDMKTYNVKFICAHNARFDKNALDVTLRYITKSAQRFWFPFGTEWWDTMKMARDVVHKMPTFRKWCEKYDCFTATGRMKATAEVLYSFITKNPDFSESHTGLEDVEIESVILAYCFKQHKKMRKGLYEK